MQSDSKGNSHKRNTTRWLLGLVAVAAAVGAGGSAVALKPVRITPQGEVARVNQFQVQFDRQAIAAGASDAAAPYRLACSGQADIPAHTGAWRNASTWVADFDDDLPAGVRCVATPVAGFRSPTGEALPTGEITFQTGAPFIRSISPEGEVAEDQIFVLRFNGDVDAASVQAGSQCRIQGVGEQAPTTLVTGAERAAIVESRWYADAVRQHPDRFVLLRCNRTLPASASVQLSVGAYQSKTGQAHKTPQTFDFTVRAPFEATFTCERPSAQAACMPTRPLRLEFNAPVPMQYAQHIQLKGNGQVLTPAFGRDADATSVQAVEFASGLAEQTTWQIVLPTHLRDDAGRPLHNAATFPLTVHTGPTPPLVKFAAAPFGVVERFAEGKDSPALLPVTVRKVEAGLAALSLQPGGTITSLTPQTDPDIIKWYRRMRHYDDATVTRKVATADGVRHLPPVWPKAKSDEEEDVRVEDDRVETRAISLLDGLAGTHKTQLPQLHADDPRPFEVVGIPLPVGFHVVEIASGKLANILSPHYGSQQPMYVRTSALVTNLAVHFKHGRESSLVWVTRLDNGKPVPDAAVAISDCDGKLLANGITDAHGIWQAKQPLSGPYCNHPEYGRSESEGGPLFASARVREDGGTTDMAFVWSDWDRGIEAWRFQVPTDMRAQASLLAHSVLDRTLLRAGETVSMKHFIQAQTLAGLDKATRMPSLLRITHTGSDEQIDTPLVWRTTATGTQVAESTWRIPPAAKLGQYQLSLIIKDDTHGETVLDSGALRVEEFRLPVMHGSIRPADSQAPLVALNKLPVQVQLAYINGGAAAGMETHISASATPGALHFAGFDAFSFGKQAYTSDADAPEYEQDSTPHTRLLANRLPLKLGADGAGTVTIEGIPTSTDPLDVTLEASYQDPNGEFQSIQSRQRIWPAAVVAGIRTESWVSVNKDVRLQALALNTAGQPQSGVRLSVRAIAHTTTTSRKRLVGGFYTYDNQRNQKDLGEICSGRSDSRGLLLCVAQLGEPGEVELIATATDDAGHSTQASTNVTVTRQGEIWWGGDDHDRMDVLPERRQYQPGETARLQVRMPFRYATALLTVEREGVLHSEVVQLSGQDPTVELKIRPEWGPNVYVSVLALRGRLREVPWYSFFTWGLRAPREWWHAFRHEGREYIAPTPLVDLSKPAFRLGMAELDIGVQAHTIQVQVKPERNSYQVRESARVHIQATLPDGKPAAHAEIAVAVVDKALLELMPNRSWDVLHAMYQRRAWGVETATAQMEIIGRRHYGLKAVPAGGDGGQGGHTRELFDTLLLWNPRIELDANGQASLDVPLNDALTTFQIVAVASSGQHLFGTGEASMRTTQDLQIISGLPPLVREGDQYQAHITLRNGTDQAMQVEVTPHATGLELKPQTVKIAAGAAQDVLWDVTVPAQQALEWHITATDHAGSKASDSIRLSQRIIPAVPLTVQQATLAQIDGVLQLDVAAPQGSLHEPGSQQPRGGVKIALQPTLAGGLPGVRDWFAHYPHTCLEQQTSKAIGLRDAALWQRLMNDLPTYLDSDGLAGYFPAQKAGSDVLTAHLLAASHTASQGQASNSWQLPAPARERMLSALVRFVEGKLERNTWHAPRPDRDLRKIAAIEALSRYGKATPAMLSSLSITPQSWPTHTVIDWVGILQRMPSLAERDSRLAEAMHILRTRLNLQGTRLAFHTEANDDWWWLMQRGDTNAARLLLAVQADPAWASDMGALATGLIGRQQHGAWSTTTANLWGALALEQFAARFEKAPVTGTTRITLGNASSEIDWNKVKLLDKTTAAEPASSPASAPTTASGSISPWFGARAQPGTYSGNTAFLPWAGSGAAQLAVAQQGSGKPWVTIQSLAAVPTKQEHSAGYRVVKRITPVQETNKGSTTRGDIWQITLDITANSDMSWVAVSDPIPAGATILGSGLGRDTAIATAAPTASDAAQTHSDTEPAFIERSFDAWRAYYAYLPRGTTHISYRVRLNSAGTFHLPPTRVEALYAPEIYGVSPNATVTVQPR